MAPLLATDPNRAYRILTTSGIELPPDLEAELAALMARVRETWGTVPPPKETAEKPKPPSNGSPGFRPLPPGLGDDPDPRKPGPSEEDARARALWAESRGDRAA